MDADRSVTGLAIKPASPAPSLPPRILNPARAQETAHWLRASGDRCFLLHRRRCTTALASDKAARQLAACWRLPCRVLHHARGFATGFVVPAIAVPPAPTFGIGMRLRVLPATCAVGDKAAHGSGGYVGGALACARCARVTQPGRGKSQAIEHNSALPKVGQSLRRASLGGLPLRALRVRVMVCYVLRPSPDNGYFGSRCSRGLFGRCAQGGVDAPPALRVCPGGAPCKT
jgi:hypothetical protein